MNHLGHRTKAQVNTQAEQETKAKSHSGTDGESVYKTEKTMKIIKGFIFWVVF